jgi:hypothetical protein
MKNKIAIYLAGAIQKGHETDEKFWTEAHIRALHEGLKPYEVSILNPAYRSDDLSDPLSIFGRDMLQVFSSDFVFLDARDRRGLGVGAEMMWAKLHHIPLVIWAPNNTHYNKSHASILGVDVKDYVHPFVSSLGDKIVHTLEEGIQWIKQVKSNPEIQIKGLDSIENAMLHYRSTQLAHDQPMLDLMQANQTLHSRFNFSIIS